MTEHRGSSFVNSCVKVPIDRYSRQPTPSYERPRPNRNDLEPGRRINFARVDDSNRSSPRDTLDNLLEFLDSIPDYEQVHHLTNEQFKQKLEYLRRRQRLLMENLRNSLDRESQPRRRPETNAGQSTGSTRFTNHPDLSLSGKKCYLEESRTSSPVLFKSGSFAGLAEDQDLLTYRSKEKEAKTARNLMILEKRDRWNELVSEEETNDSDSIETRSLPAESSRNWQPTVPKPFSFTLREEAERYMTREEAQQESQTRKKSSKKRKARPVPLTSKIPLYEKLMAEKEERSRLVREESALNLMSQVRPFRLECERRAWRSLARSSPEICGKGRCPKTRFKAKPVPRSLFGTGVYDRMLEDEYYRQLKKRVRAAELMKSSSLPPSMARRERVKSAFANLQNDRASNRDSNEPNEEADSCRRSSPVCYERSLTMSSLPIRGNNLASVLRCQASREKLEREIKDRMEEKRREQTAKLKEALTGRKPVWRALRSAARHEHERDLDIRASLRRDEAREQAELHRLQMELMLDRVTQIPTLFQRHSQSYQSLVEQPQKLVQRKQTQKKKKKKKKKLKRESSDSADSCASYGSDSRPDSGSMTSSSGTIPSLSHSYKSSSGSVSHCSAKSGFKPENSCSKRRPDRGQLKVSINETAELIDDNPKENLSRDCRSSSSVQLEQENGSRHDQHNIT